MWAWLIGKTAGPVLGGALVALLIAASVSWGVSAWKINALEKQLETARDEIDNPNTGWRVRLSACDLSVKNITTALGNLQNGVDGMIAAQKERDQLIAAQLAALQKSFPGLQARVDQIINRPERPAPQDACKSALGILGNPR